MSNILQNIKIIKKIDIIKIWKLLRNKGGYNHDITAVKSSISPQIIEE